MEILKFTLSGKSACFRKPEVNAYCYFTYGNIHKIALLGIFGAILGYGGYNQIAKFVRKKGKTEIQEDYPQFYEQLKELKIAILPKEGSKGMIAKKIQTFNNSVGYASREQGGNLVVKEQWLENPSWDICVLVDSEEAEKLKNAIVSKRCVYLPYLGKNDHPADITDVEVIDAQPAVFRVGRLNCLTPEDMVAIADLDEDEKEELDAYESFKYQEMLPWAMDGWLNQYQLRKFLYTDAFVEVKDAAVYQIPDGRNLILY